MKRDVRLARSAARDLIRLNAFLAEKSPRAAQRAMHAISSGLRSLSDSAERGRLAGETVRELRIAFGRDGYVVRYRVGVADVLVTRIFHAREQR